MLWAGVVFSCFTGRSYCIFGCKELEFSEVFSAYLHDLGSRFSVFLNMVVGGRRSCRARPTFMINSLQVEYMYIHTKLMHCGYLSRHRWRLGRGHHRSSRITSTRLALLQTTYPNDCRYFQHNRLRMSLQCQKKSYGTPVLLAIYTYKYHEHYREKVPIQYGPGFNTC